VKVGRKEIKEFWILFLGNRLHIAHNLKRVGKKTMATRISKSVALAMI
jgi:hypothetical protein